MIERSAVFDGQLDDAEVLGVADQLAGLTAHPGWALYLELLKNAKTWYRQLGFEDDSANFQQWKGRVEGLESATEIVPQILARAQVLGRQTAAKTGVNPLRGGTPDAAGTFD